MKDDVKQHKNPRGEASVDPLVNALNDRPQATPASGMGWRIAVAILLLAGLAALVYKQSF